MIRNTAGQFIGAQMLDTTGAAFAGTVTVYLTLDAGTQAIGTVGAGVCTLEGNGYYTYRPSTAETSADLIAFTFVGTGAIPVTIQVVTITAAQTVAVGSATVSTKVGQDLLSLMEICNQELQLQTGETDVTRGLLALNVAQDYFETLAAVRKIKGGQTAEIYTTGNTESTAFPVGFLRIDGIQRLDASAGNPVSDLDRIQRTGGHVGRPFRIMQFSGTAGVGQPAGYWTNGSNIFWSPKPNTTYYLRVYGFQRAADITAAGAFSYDDAVMLPLATFASRLLAIGIGDPVGDIQALATETFKAVLDALEEFNRDGGNDLRFERTHRA